MSVSGLAKSAGLRYALMPIVITRREPASALSYACPMNGWMRCSHAS